MPAEYNITQGGTKQPGQTIEFYNANCINPDPISDPTWEAPAYCASFLVGRTWTFAPYFFNGVGFDNDRDPIELNGFNIGFRVYSSQTILPFNDPTDPTRTGPSSVSRTYAGFRIISQEFKAAVDRELYSLQPNAVNFFTVEPGYYPGETREDGVVIPPPYQNAGIKNGSHYEYGGVFDEGNISYIPRLSPSSQKAINGAPPSSPYNEEEGIYPIDALTGYSPDPRTSVTIVYTLKTVFIMDGSDEEETSIINITQVVTQPDPNQNLADQIENFIEKAYYTYGEFGVKIVTKDIVTENPDGTTTDGTETNVLTLWPNDEPPLYDEEGEPIPPIPRVSSTSGQTYDQRINGDGFNNVYKE